MATLPSNVHFYLSTKYPCKLNVESLSEDNVDYNTFCMHHIPSNNAMINYFAKCATKLFHNMNAIGRSLIGMPGGLFSLQPLWNRFAIFPYQYLLPQ